MPDIKLITENLADELIPGIQREAGIYILTSFVMESGVRLLAPYLREAMNAERKYPSRSAALAHPYADD